MARCDQMKQFFVDTAEKASGGLSAGDSAVLCFSSAEAETPPSGMRRGHPNPGDRRIMRVSARILLPPPLLSQGTV